MFLFVAGVRPQLDLLLPPIAAGFVLVVCDPNGLGGDQNVSCGDGTRGYVDGFAIIVLGI